MRHYFPDSIAHLAARVRATSSALLVSPSGFSLARTPPVPCALGLAVSRPSDVAERAQQDEAPAVRSLADNDVQRDHGPRRRVGLDFCGDLCEPEWVAPQLHGPAGR